MPRMSPVVSFALLVVFIAAALIVDEPQHIAAPRFGSSHVALRALYRPPARQGQRVRNAYHQNVDGSTSAGSTAAPDGHGKDTASPAWSSTEGSLSRSLLQRWPYLNELVQKAAAETYAHESSSSSAEDSTGHGQGAAGHPRLTMGAAGAYVAAMTVNATHVTAITLSHNASAVANPIEDVLEMNPLLVISAYSRPSFLNGSFPDGARDPHPWTLDWRDTMRGSCHMAASDDHQLALGVRVQRHEEHDFVVRVYTYQGPASPPAGSPRRTHAEAPPHGWRFRRVVDGDRQPGAGAAAVKESIAAAIRALEDELHAQKKAAADNSTTADSGTYGSTPTDGDAAAKAENVDNNKNNNNNKDTDGSGDGSGDGSDDDADVRRAKMAKLVARTLAGVADKGSITAPPRQSPSVSAGRVGPGRVGRHVRSMFTEFKLDGHGTVSSLSIAGDRVVYARLHDINAFRTYVYSHQARRWVRGTPGPPLKMAEFRKTAALGFQEGAHTPVFVYPAHLPGFVLACKVTNNGEHQRLGLHYDLFKLTKRVPDDLLEGFDAIRKEIKHRFVYEHVKWRSYRISNVSPRHVAGSSFVSASQDRQTLGLALLGIGMVVNMTKDSFDVHILPETDPALFGGAGGTPASMSPTGAVLATYDGDLVHVFGRLGAHSSIVSHGGGGAADEWQLLHSVPVRPDVAVTGMHFYSQPESDTPMLVVLYADSGIAHYAVGAPGASGAFDVFSFGGGAAMLSDSPTNWKLVIAVVLLLAWAVRREINIRRNIIIVPANLQQQQQQQAPVDPPQAVPMADGAAAGSGNGNANDGNGNGSGNGNNGNGNDGNGNGNGEEAHPHAD